MNVKLLGTLAALMLPLLLTAPAFAQDNQAPVEDLGDGRYKIGTIEVDKNAQRFTVPGAIIDLAENSPIEFLAVSKGGHKAYESVFELETSAAEFNLACILIGLDEKNATRPRGHFDPAKVTGDEVDIQVSWENGGKEQVHEIERLLRGADDTANHTWVYTGSFFTPQGDYVAEMTGTLIGVVHDPESIIQHQDGLGLGNYGAVTLDPDIAPPKGTPLTVSVFRVAE